MKKNINIFTVLITSIAFGPKPFFHLLKLKAATVYFSGAEISANYNSKFTTRYT